MIIGVGASFTVSCRIHTGETGYYNTPSELRVREGRVYLYAWPRIKSNGRFIEVELTTGNLTNLEPDLWLELLPSGEKISRIKWE